ncbi:3,4-dihydroxy-2-butanone-4-phosphate synthase [Timonella sp. A28]|uniref:3,4-dihydroxy-2-butanone-4-phosphate synthase n=1 Tax=Timonella sp. A28 TaxID=3442640 RepID=UPI003EBC054D
MKDLVIAALREGRPVLVADAHDRENEVDVILSAQVASSEWIAWTVRYTSGYLCAPMPNELADALNLPLMVADSEDPRRTAYCVSVDAAQGVTTGISAHDRALTLRLLADPTATPEHFIRPGHVLPLRAVAGGLTQRQGHTEAAVALCELAGLSPVGVIGELVCDDGSMMRYDEATSFAREHDVLLISIEEIAEWTAASPLSPEPAGGRITRTGTAQLPTEDGTFTLHSFADSHTGVEHAALVSAQPGGHVRIHSECLTGDAFGSLRCDCGPQLRESMRIISQQGGALIYLRGHEGRGIGFGAKVRAYALQEDGLDTVDANIALGFPPDLREYGAAAEIVRFLAHDNPALLDSLTLISNNPLKSEALASHGIAVADTHRMPVHRTEFNAAYLATKESRMGHSYASLSHI